jgi:hypothetical protein
LQRGLGGRAENGASQQRDRRGHTP